jgi:hypothetical protein
MFVRAFDGYDWGNWDAFNFTAVPNALPSATIADHSVATGHWAQALSWLTYSDADGDPASSYQFIDGGTGAGSAQLWTPGTGYQAPGTYLTVAASDLGTVYIGGATATGTDLMFVRAFDGHDWGNWDPFTVTSHA